MEVAKKPMESVETCGAIFKSMQLYNNIIVECLWNECRALYIGSHGVSRYPKQT